MQGLVIIFCQVFYKEYELARVNNNFIIPVPATGQEAAKIYEKNGTYVERL